MVGRSKTIAGTLFFLLLVAFASPASAQVIQIPDCRLYPTHPFCLYHPRDPIVFVPGLGTSYNGRVLFKDKPGGVWMFPPFYDVYTGLLTRLRNIGYVENEDLFIAYYDWRQSNTESATEYLAPIIAEALERSATGKIDIVAHSMGGLVAQEYIKSEAYSDGVIDQFIMLGTPNAGASNAYLPWEGGVLPPTWGVIQRNYIDSIESSLKKTRNFKAVAPLTYRQFFPSLKELLPTGDFITKDGAVVPRGELAEQNPFLEELGNFRETLAVEYGIGITTIAGTGELTLDNISLQANRTAEDIALGRWRDGHPVEEVPLPNSEYGDQTVLESSALFGEEGSVSLLSLPGVSHNDLPEHAQNQVLETLGILDNEEQIFIYEEPEWLTGFVVLSPVDIVITDSTGKTVSKTKNDFGDDAFVDISEDESADDPKVIMIQNLPPGTYTAKLTGTGTGEYTVITTHTSDTESVSETRTGNTKPGKQESFTVTIGDNGNSATVSQITKPRPSTPMSLECIRELPRLIARIAAQGGSSNLLRQLENKRAKCMAR